MVNVTKIRQLAKEKGITLTHLCSLCGQQRGWIKDIANKNLDIPEDKLQIIADDLGTTTDYLRDKSEQKNKAPDLQGLTPEQLKLFHLYAALDERQKEVISELLDSMLRSHDKDI